MNGILMITYYETERQHGAAPMDAMFRAASTRMRPLLMTALSACIGLFPAAISTGIGSQVQRPLATVMVGGMLLGPVMLLLVVPALQAEFLAKADAPPETASSSMATRRCAFWIAVAAFTPLGARGQNAAGAHPPPSAPRAGAASGASTPLTLGHRPHLAPKAARIRRPKAAANNRSSFTPTGTSLSGPGASGHPTTLPAGALIPYAAPLGVLSIGRLPGALAGNVSPGLSRGPTHTPPLVPDSRRALFGDGPTIS